MNEAVAISEIQLDYLNHESSHQIVYVVCKPISRIGVVTILCPWVKSADGA